MTLCDRAYTAPRESASLVPWPILLGLATAAARSALVDCCSTWLLRAGPAHTSSAPRRTRRCQPAPRQLSVRPYRPPAATRHATPLYLYSIPVPAYTSYMFSY